jgi:hypothetical protein
MSRYNKSYDSDSESTDVLDGYLGYSDSDSSDYLSTSKRKERRQENREDMNEIIRLKKKRGDYLNPEESLLLKTENIRKNLKKYKDKHPKSKHSHLVNTMLKNPYLFTSHKVNPYSLGSSMYGSEMFNPLSGNDSFIKNVMRDKVLDESIKLKREYKQPLTAEEKKHFKKTLIRTALNDGTNPTEQAYEKIKKLKKKHPLDLNLFGGGFGYGLYNPFGYYGSYGKKGKKGKNGGVLDPLIKNLTKDPVDDLDDLINGNQSYDDILGTSSRKKYRRKSKRSSTTSSQSKRKTTYRKRTKSLPPITKGKSVKRVVRRSISKPSVRKTRRRTIRRSKPLKSTTRRRIIRRSRSLSSTTRTRSLRRSRPLSSTTRTRSLRRSISTSKPKLTTSRRRISVSSSRPGIRIQSIRRSRK